MVLVCPGVLSWGLCRREFPWKADGDTMCRPHLGSSAAEPLCLGSLVKLRFYKGWKGGGNRTKVNVRSPPTYAACSAKAVAQHEAAKRAGG